MSTRKIKKQVLALLAGPDLDRIQAELARLPAKDVVNALFFGICRSEELVRWHAVSAMGTVVSRLATAEMEEGRLIMRRLLWSLNDESGGIGWGVPQAMAEVVAQVPALARGYLTVFLSYIWEEGNYLEFIPIQREVLKGVLRLIEACPVPGPLANGASRRAKIRSPRPARRWLPGLSLES